MKPEWQGAAGSRGSVIMWSGEQETGHWWAHLTALKGPCLDAARHRRTVPPASESGNAMK